MREALQHLELPQCFACRGYSIFTFFTSVCQTRVPGEHPGGFCTTGFLHIHRLSLTEILTTRLILHFPRDVRTYFWPASDIHILDFWQPPTKLPYWHLWRQVAPAVSGSNAALHCSNDITGNISVIKLVSSQQSSLDPSCVCTSPCNNIHLAVGELCRRYWDARKTVISHPAAAATATAPRRDDPGNTTVCQYVWLHGD